MAKRQYESKIAIAAKNFVDIKEQPTLTPDENTASKQIPAKESTDEKTSEEKFEEDRTSENNQSANDNHSPATQDFSIIKDESQSKAPLSVQISKRGRKPSENTMERDFISVNIGDGVREDLVYLCRRHEKQTGKKSVGLATYIRYLVEKDIAENKKYLDAAKAFDKEFE